MLLVKLSYPCYKCPSWSHCVGALEVPETQGKLIKKWKTYFFKNIFIEHLTNYNYKYWNITIIHEIIYNIVNFLAIYN